MKEFENRSVFNKDMDRSMVPNNKEKAGFNIFFKDECKGAVCSLQRYCLISFIKCLFSFTRPIEEEAQFV